MFTTQQKRETVERFLSSGLTISAASRLEGYPERHRLSSWLREAREGTLVVTPTPAPGRVAHHVRGHRYPSETVEEALRTTRVALALVESMNRGGWVAVEEA